MPIIHNNLLFNHTYLAQLERDGSVDDDASNIAAGVRDWYGFMDTDSAQALADSWVQPVFSILELDLAPLAHEENGWLVVSSWNPGRPLALCYITPPGADLDTTTKGRHWMAQAVLAARRWRSGDVDQRDAGTQDDNPPSAGAHPGLRWVILTNGEQWRLLDAHALRRYEAFLQVDLGALAREEARIESIRVFYRCFQRSAFEVGDDGKSGLEKLLEASAAATERAEKHLKQRVSHDDGIMAQLSRGFVAAAGKSQFTAEERDAIYRDATYLLYRLLFILYAEARDLLPVSEAGYAPGSLRHTVALARRYQEQGMPDPQGTSLWQRLQALFTAIDKGDEALGVPAYNGGLFDNGPAAIDKPHLRDSHIADAYLASALQQLAFIDGRPLDYRDLSVRHLGSLYEGMIEYRLFVAEEPMLARRDDKGNIHYLPQAEAGGLRKTDQRIDRGDVYFAQSSGERRATGTYYTPEYIVHYIVANTVTRGLQERRASLEQKLQRWQEELAGASTAEKGRLQRQVDARLRAFVEQQILTFRVCDPAMGSGHFLVNASHQITNVIVETLHLTQWQNDDLQTSPDHWRRRVAESCLYGVDINGMAVELAKLSLWLASLARDKPLGFLDHHLRQGNSLIGARLDDFADALGGKPARRSRKEQKAREAGQLSLLERMDFQERVGLAADMMAHISQTVSESLADVKAQAAEYEEVREALEPFRRLADLLVARHFGVAAGARELQEAAKYLTNGSVTRVPAYEGLLEQAGEQQEEYDFFHWELEFPEVFFGADGEAEESDGFDAVVGNPPYGAPPHSPVQAYLRLVYTPGFLDSYIMFVERGLKLTRQHAMLGLIIPNTWTQIFGAQEFRRFLISSYELVRIVHHASKVFEEVTVDTEILIAANAQPAHNTTAIEIWSSGEHKTFHINQQDWIDKDGDIISVVADPAVSAVVSKIEDSSQPLASLFDVRNGIKPFEVGKGDPPQTQKIALEQPYVSDERADNSFRPLLRGSLIDRYANYWSEDYWVSYGPWLAAPRDPEIFSAPEKLVVRQTGSELIATLVDSRFVARNNLHIILPNIEQEKEVTLRYLLVLLNSKLLNFYYHYLNPESGETFAEVKLAHLERLPIASILSNIRSLHYHDLPWNEIALDLENTDSAVFDTLANLMLSLNERRLSIEKALDLFLHIPKNTHCKNTSDALSSLENPFQSLQAIHVIHHDVEALRLNQDDDCLWLLELYVKERDPQTGWKEHRRDAEGNFIRRWLPAYRLQLDDNVGRYYHYVFQNLDGFENAGKFPGGYTRTTEQKLLATKIPEYVEVDLTPLEEAEAELAEVQRKIKLTDELIDQIVYKLYGLTEEEIAIVEGRA